MKRFLWPLVIVVVLLGSALLWHITHPALTPEEQVAAQLEGLRQEVENRNARRAMYYLAPDFAWESSGGANRKQVANGMNSTFLLWRDVHVELSGVQTTVDGEKASSRGNLRMTFRQSPDAQPETHTSTFALEWALRDGNWKVVKARGGADIAGGMGG